MSGSGNSSAVSGAYAADRIIVQFDPQASIAMRTAALNAIGAKGASALQSSFSYVSDLPASNTSDRTVVQDLSFVGSSVTVTLNPSMSVSQALTILASQPGVRLAEPDLTLHASFISNDPSYTSGSLWGLQGDASTPANAYGSQAAEVWTANVTGSTKTVVGVIDSGIDYTHKDLYLNIWLNQGEIPTAFKSSLTDTDGDRLITFRDLNAAVNAAFVKDVNANGYIDGGDLLNDSRWEDGADGDANGYIDDLIGWDFANNDNDPMDDQSHGTHVAGTIGAIGGNAEGVAGVNWAIQMIPLKFILSTGSGATSAAVAALNYYNAAASRYAAIEDFVATNNSWGGGGYSATMATAINNTARAGQLFIAAAGNSNSNNDSVANYPSNYSTLAAAGFEAVVAVAAITGTGARASFSSYGVSTVDIGAPGNSILSTLPGGRYGYMSGTSMATPHVTGALALLASAHPELSAAQLRSYILDNAAPTAALSGLVATGGRLDLSAVFARFASATNPPVDTTAPGLSGITLSDSALKVGETATVTFSFSEAVTGFTQADVAYDTAAGTLSNFAQVAGSTTQWTALYTPKAGVTDSSNVITVAAGTYADAAGNAGLAGSSANFSIDTAPPTATTFQLSRTALSSGQSATLTIVFSEAVNGFAINDLTCNTALGALSNLVQGTGNQWTVTYTALTNVSTSGTTITLSAGSYADAAGNAGTGAVSGSITITNVPQTDTTPPSVTAFTVSPSPIKAGSTATVTITFSEVVNGFTLSDIGYDAAAGTLSALTQSTADAKTWTATYTPLANVSDAANTLTIAAGAYADAAGNSGLAGTSANFAVDTSAPAVSAMQMSTASLSIGQTATLTITFNEAVSGLTLSDFSYNTAVGTLSNLAQAAGTNQWTATYTPNAGVQSTGNSISLVSASYTDIAGNAGPGATSPLFAVSTQATTTPSQLQVIGTSARDTLTGTSAGELISGVPLTGASLGSGTIDTLTGGGGNDVFLLGDARGLFYNDDNTAKNGKGDYALITDFSRGDSVRLNAGYAYFLVDTSLGRTSGAGIYADTNRSGGYDGSDELVGVLQNVSAASLQMGFATYGGTNYAVIS